MKHVMAKLGVMTLFTLSMASCKKDDMPGNGIDGVQLGKDLDITLYALSGGLSIDKINTSNLNTVMNTAALTGLQNQETILAMDYRPATGQLYGISSTSRLYVINPETGVSRMIGTAPITPAIAGGIAAFDFNPTVDRIRLVTTTGQNLRLNPETATTAATDGAINGISGAMISGAAYTNNIAGATTTTLYDIDVATKKLYRQIPPNDGKLVEVGALNLAITGEGGFDIAAKDSVAVGLYSVGGKPTLFVVSLANGNASTLATYDRATPYTAIAIPTNPVAYATDANNNLHLFNPNMPGTVVTKMITGLAAGERVMGIDFRPLNGQLYGLTNTSRVITLNTSSGAATIVGTISTPLAGTEFAFDFNPTVDRIRIMSNTGQNLRYNPNDAAAAVLVDGTLKPATPVVTAAAYANNFAGATTTMLFDIDVMTDKLYLQNPPNDGVLVEIGNLGVNVEASNGFDIGSTSGAAWALLTVGNQTKLYAINTTSGAATARGDFPVQATGFSVGLGF